MTKVASQYDITVVFCEIGIPILGMLVLIAATWTTNTTNAYSGGINAVMMLNLADEKRAIATMVSGMIGTICALVGLADHFEALYQSRKVDTKNIFCYFIFSKVDIRHILGRLFFLKVDMTCIFCYFSFFKVDTPSTWACLRRFATNFGSSVRLLPSNVFFRSISPL